MNKRPWHQIEPRDAVNIQLPDPSIQGPYNEMGEECPWPWDPPQLAGAPIGQYHCQYCGAMVMAGMHHIDYGAHDENGVSQSDRDYAEWVAGDMRANGATEEEIQERLGDWWK